MTYRRSRIFVMAGLIALGSVPEGRGQDVLTELSGSRNPRLFDTHFARYGYAPLKTIQRRDKHLRITLPAATPGVGQTGLYSHVVLAGDFEVAIRFAWVATPGPKSGYGVSCGIAVDTMEPDGNVSLARTFQPDKVATNSFAVTRGRPAEGEVKYETDCYPARANAGRLTLKREKSEVVCLVGEGNGALRELCRLPFTTNTIRQVRIYADPGGAPTSADVWLSDFVVRAQEITGGFPERDRKSPLNWELPLLIISVGMAVICFVVRRRQRRAESTD